MLTNSLSADRESVSLTGAARIRAAIAEEHESLLRSIAVLVAKTDRRLPWPEVMDTAVEILHEAVQQSLQHAVAFDTSQSATAWIRGIAARLLMSRRRALAEAGDAFLRPPWERRLGRPRSSSCAPDRPTRRSLDGSTWRRRLLAFPRKSDTPSSAATTGGLTEPSWRGPWALLRPVPHACGYAGHYRHCGRTFPLARKGFFHEQRTRPLEA
jgi:hypothetical protein